MIRLSLTECFGMQRQNIIYLQNGLALTSAEQSKNILVVGSAGEGQFVDPISKAFCQYKM